MPNGILVIDKPPEWTSHDVVAKVRGILREKRVGHSGTLDPMATGVLPVFVGRATRAVEFAAEAGKEYVAGLRLGVETDTWDTTGTTLETKHTEVTDDELEAALTLFRGDILQIPPMYSAIKIAGKKLYELARKGVEVEREPRPVTIHELELLERTAPSDFLIRINCSKGTYIRSLCHDIGATLGCGGTMCSLRRTRAAGYSEAQTITLEALQAAEQAGEAARLLLPVDSYFAKYPSLTVSAEEEKLVRNGLAYHRDGPQRKYRLYGADGSFLALAQIENNKMKTIKSFFEVV